MTLLDLPATLRLIRGRLDLTQADLAAKLGVSFATVNRWEGGSTKPQNAPMARILEVAAEAGIGAGEVEASTIPSPPRRRGRGLRAEAPSTKTMEQMLWDAACSIRGEKDAPKFKDYLLPLLFLKRLSDVFDDEVARLAEEFGDEAIALEIAESDHSLLRFYLPPEARWGVISGRVTYEWPADERGRPTQPRDIGEHLTKAVRAAVRYNPDLSGVIDVVDFAAERNGERDINPAKLRGVVETFSDPRYRLGLADVQPDFLGRAYEYLLRKFAEGSGQSAGEFFTPTEVGFLMANIMRPKPGETCHDYACGSGGLLIKLQLVARELDPTSKVPLKMYGQELQAESYAVARMNTIIHDMDVDLQRGDTMINPKFRDSAGSLMRFDIVVANPMWNQPLDPDLYGDDPFDRFLKAGGPTSGRGDWAWLQHTVATMKDGGRAAVVLDTGALTRGSGSKNEDKERLIRKWFIEHDLIDGVILLPPNLFYNTPAAGVIVILSKRKPAPRKGKIVLLNASQRYVKGKPKNHIAWADVADLARVYLAGTPVDGELVVADASDVAAADYNLNPSHWVGPAEDADDVPIGSLLGELGRLHDEFVSRTSRLMALVGPTAEGGSASAPWPTEAVGKCLAPVALPAVKLPTAEYRPSGKYPIIDQGQAPIAGWTDNEEGVIAAQLPVIVFGDHTRTFKYVDFPFVRGADGTQVLKPRSDLHPRFFYYACKALDLSSRGYNRHFTLLKEKSIPVPSWQEQVRIAEVLEAVDEHGRLQAEQMEATVRLFRVLLHRLMSGEIQPQGPTPESEPQLATVAK